MKELQRVARKMKIQKDLMVSCDYYHVADRYYSLDTHVVLLVYYGYACVRICVPMRDYKTYASVTMHACVTVHVYLFQC